MNPYSAYQRLARDPAQQYHGPPPGVAHVVKPETPSAIPDSPSPALPDPRRVLQAPSAVAYGPRKLPDSDAPPNVTVSTSTIPLSMAGGPQRRRGSDLSGIVHQINQLCQARAGAGATSVCEGQIANPGPISRNLLIDASSRVASPHVGERAAPPPVGPRLGPPAAISPADAERVRRRRVWTGPVDPEGTRPCKNPRSDPQIERTFPARTLGYLCGPAPRPSGPVGPYADEGYGFHAAFRAGAGYRRRAETTDPDFLMGRDLATGGFAEPDVDSRDGPRDAACALYPAYR
ncbi:protein FAM222B-like [Corythoichthys intestinalis]|uniref:protein FAM222B-like n=1 Tax=Corythoichthys intestinalis TaxID=161448 RepID=UPI0025A50BD7|nr:protein FAM222B-like [Corythoichthys intestinalis]